MGDDDDASLFQPEPFFLFSISTTMMLSLSRRLVSTQQQLPSRLLQQQFCRYISSTVNASTKRVETTIDAKTGIAKVTLARPEKLNALDIDMFYAVRDAALALQDNRSVRAVILSGQGRSFCTGLDFKKVMMSTSANKNMETLLHRDDGRISNLAQDVCYLWRQLPVPVVCVLHGMCYGGGLQIALGADFRFATPDCKLSIMEAKWGLIPDMGASIVLRELVRADVAKELIMTGRVVDGTEAAALGLVTKIVDDPMTEAEQWLKEHILPKSPDALAMAKEMVQKTWVAQDEEYCLKVETDLQRKLLISYNQLAAAGSNLLGVQIPYWARQQKEDTGAAKKKDNE
jgi:enoyl-CoA hydratase/carnithine racemase